jgi:hypothetical protein
MSDYRETWIVGEPGGPAGPFYSVVTERGRVVAMQIPSQADAILISQIPRLVELQAEWSGIINRLANIALDGADSNERGYAQEMIRMVAPYLEAEMYTIDQDVHCLRSLPDLLPPRRKQRQLPPLESPGPGIGRPLGRAA